jgi:very-short-patch-repair endonuclease
VTQLFNRPSAKKTRQSLRNSLPPAELILWSKLKNRQINAQKFRRQFSIGPYIVDFYCPALKLGIEIDGDSHFQPGEQEKDITRQKFIEAKGVQFLRFRNIEVRENLRGVLEAVYRKIDELRKPE